MIAPNLGAVSRIVDDGENGILVEPKSASMLADAMERLTQSPEQAEAMGERGRRKATREFKWEQRGSKLKALYDQLLNS